MFIVGTEVEIGRKVVIEIETETENVTGIVTVKEKRLKKMIDVVVNVIGKRDDVAKVGPEIVNTGETADLETATLDVPEIGITGVNGIGNVNVKGNMKKSGATQQNNRNH